MPAKRSDQFAKRSALSFTRRVDVRDVKRRFLIVCEGAQTEVNYFESFRVPGRVVEVHGLGKNTLTLVEEAIEIKAREEKRGEFDQCWCVFDRDDFPVDHFNNAVLKANAAKFQVAFSNEAFELWYLLHFHYHDARLSREAYGDMLTRLLGQRYDKSGSYYQILLSKQDAAIKNAKRLMNSYAQDQKPHECCPGTTVHLLVEELNKNA